MIGKYVVVTTDKRGVFAGVLESGMVGGGVVIRECRNCRFWSKETNGFLGLATVGPQPGSMLGPAALRTALSGVTSITVCSEEAERVWREYA